MKKIYIYSFLCCLINTLHINTSDNIMYDNKLELILNVPLCYTKVNSNKKHEEIIQAFYKGTQYSVLVSSQEGGLLSIYDDNFEYSVNLIIASFVRKRIINGKVIGLAIPESADYAWYKIDYKILKDGKALWKAELQLEEDVKIPENSLILIADPNNIIIDIDNVHLIDHVPLKRDFSLGVLIMPMLKINGTIGNVGRILEVEECHSTKE
jgi:hypothetical protein